MDRMQRRGLAAAAVAGVAAVAMIVLWPEADVSVDDNVKTRVIQRDEAPVLSEKLSERVVERHSGLLRVRTAAGELDGGVRWRFQADRPADEDLQLRDADGRPASFAPSSAGGGDTLEFTTRERVTAKLAQSLARQVLVDPKLEIVEQGRGRSRFLAISSDKLVAVSILLEARKVRFVGLFPRNLCSQAAADRAGDRYGITLACSLSPNPRD